MSQLRRLSKGLMVLVILTMELDNSTGQKNTVVLAHHLASEDSQITQANFGYIEAQHRIQEALQTQASVLHLRKLSLTQIPPQIGLLTNLQELYLGKNQLSSLPEEIGQLKHLKKLQLGRNKLKKLPDQITQLSTYPKLIT